MGKLSSCLFLRSIPNRDSWHADIKPANILEIGDLLKLADPGFAKFKENNKGKGHVDPKTTMRGGTRSFGNAVSVSHELPG